MTGVQTGTPASLYERPANRFVAQFIGESNVEAGAVREAAGTGLWRVDAGGLPVLATGAGAWPPGAAVAVAVRPERIRLQPEATGGAPAAANAVAGTVEECVFRGALRRYRVRLPHGRLWSVDEPATGGTPPLGVGAPVRLEWRAEDCLVIPDE